jgi:hypothetical protein
VRILVAIVLPALAVGLTAFARGPSEEGKGDDEPLQRRKVEAARPDVLRLADSLDRDEDEIERQAQAVAEKHDLGSVMGVFKPRDKGGVGVGAKPDTILPDGIELKLLLLGKEPLTPKALEAQRDDLIHAAKVALAVSRAAPLYASQYTGHGTLRAKRDWVLYCKDMNSAAQDWIDAMNRDDFKALKKAGADLNRSCNDCHGDFREP